MRTFEPETVAIHVISHQQNEVSNDLYQGEIDSTDSLILGGFLEKIGLPRVIIHFCRWDFPVHKNHPASLGYPHTGVVDGDWIAMGSVRDLKRTLQR